MKIQCAKCHLEYEVEDQYAGQQIQCECGEIIDIPVMAPLQPPKEAKAKKPFWGAEPEYLEGFKPPFVARVFRFFKALCLGFGVLALAVSLFLLATGEGKSDFPSMFASVVSCLAGAFVMMVSELVITCLAEIAYNTRQIAKK